MFTVSVCSRLVNLIDLRLNPSCCMWKLGNMLNMSLGIIMRIIIFIRLYEHISFQNINSENIYIMLYYLCNALHIVLYHVKIWTLLRSSTLLITKANRSQNEHVQNFLGKEFYSVNHCCSLRKNLILV